jgi:hypothetical protein
VKDESYVGGTFTGKLFCNFGVAFEGEFCYKFGGKYPDRVPYYEYPDLSKFIAYNLVLYLLFNF